LQPSEKCSFSISILFATITIGEAADTVTANAYALAGSTPSLHQLLVEHGGFGDEQIELICDVLRDSVMTEGEVLDDDFKLYLMSAGLSEPDANAVRDIYLLHLLGTTPGAMQIMVGGLSDDGATAGALAAMTIGMWKYLNAPTVGIVPEEYDYRPKLSESANVEHNPIWDDNSIGHMGRGKVIDKMFGNNLGENFPTVDRLENGNLISIKSMDTRAILYQNPSRMLSTLRGYVNVLDAFVEYNWNGHNVTPASYNHKTLWMVYPRGYVFTESQIGVRNSITQYAAVSGIDVIWKPY
jgi:hypothetical protein